jgi:hypothetical protein
MTDIVLKRLEEIPKAESINCLGYGPAGSGKTYFASTAGSRQLFINNGAGLETLYKPKINPLIATVGIDDIQESAKVYDEIKNIIEYALDNNASDFDTVVIDDGTAFKHSAMHKAIEMNASSKNTKSLTRARNYDVLVPDVNDYGAEMSLTEQFVSATCAILKQEKKNFIMLAHERLTFKKIAGADGKQQMGTGELIKQTPFFTGVDKSPDYITGQFDWVLHFSAIGGGRNRSYRCRTEGDSVLTAKVRNNTFPELIANPDFLKMLEQHRGGTVYYK